MMSTRNNNRAFLLATVAMFSVALSQPAYAQVQEEQPAPQDDNSATDSDDTEIIITAQKREERILDIPQSVTVVSGDTLERQHAVTFQDYLSQVPGLSFEQSTPGVARLVLRGANTGGVSSTVAVYVDETPFGSSTGLVNGAILAGDFDTFDVSRIEVLRGPQGTLYGASSLGGVLKFVTNTPKLDAVSARGRAGIEFVKGGGTGINFSGVGNAPLGDMAALRVSGFYRKNAGWIDASGEEGSLLGAIALPSLDGKNINESQVWGGRGSLLVKPTDNLTVRLTAIVQHIESDDSSSVEVDDDYDPINGDLEQTVFFRDPNEVDYRLFNGVVDYDLGFATVLSSTSYSTSDQAFRVDLVPILGLSTNFIFGIFNPNAPGGPILNPNLPTRLTTGLIYPYQDQQTDLRKFTQEIRLASPSNDTLEWMVGGYYSNEDGKIDQFITTVDEATRQPFGIADLDTLATARIDSKYREIAGFTNVTWHLSSRFDITAGGRIAQNKQSARQITGGSPFIVGTSDFTTRSKESVFTYSVSPRFDVTDTTAVYARVAKGYRPGGPNVVSPASPPSVPRTFDSDTLTSYEVGIKTDIGRRLSLDLAAFYLDWKDIQLITVVDSVGVNINGGTAESLGVEGSLTFRPTPGLQLALNGAVIDAELTSDTPPLAGGFEGDRLPYVPKVSFNAHADYEWKLSDTATAFVGGTLSYVGKQRDNFNASDIVGVDPDTGEFIFAFTPQLRVPAYTTIDLRAGVDFGRFTVDAYVKNVTNSEGVHSLTTLEDEGFNLLPNGAIRAALTRPRTIGLSLSAGF
jgi:outer membrane receptor protein involved in Fe transport